MEPPSQHDVKFDAYADDYTTLVTRSVGVSGEPPGYFVEYKLRLLERLGVQAPLLDFGCGVGSLAEPLASRHFEVHGFDPSQKSLDTARQRAPRVHFHNQLDDVPNTHFSTALLSGVLHHVTPTDRAGVLDAVFQKLRPGGRVVVFEHNPYNPLTRHSVAQCPFDDDAILLPPREVLKRLRNAGFVHVRLDFVVFFPKLLARLRPLEPKLSWCPLGAQIMAVGCKP